MKTKTPHLFSAYRIYILAFIACIMILPVSTKADDDCYQVSSEISLQILNLDPNFDGPVALGKGIFTIGGQVFEGVVTGYVVEPVKFGEDGTMHFVLHVTQDYTESDTVTWRAYQVHSPTQNPLEYRINERATLLEGTGVFEGAFGRASVHGTSSLGTLTVQTEGKGRICNLSE